jgi:hypothetical protein
MTSFLVFSLLDDDAFKKNITLNTSFDHGAVPLEEGGTGSGIAICFVAVNR